MQLIPVKNPPNPWQSQVLDYLEGPPGLGLQVYEDQTRQIIAQNDSPDVGFRFSVNPYRGCFHACAYCLAGDTPILLASGSTRPLADLRAGDWVYGTRRDGGRRRYVRTRVRAHWSTVKQACRIRLHDGTQLISSPDHRFLTQRGWKYVVSAPGGGHGPVLARGDRLLGTGAFAAPPVQSRSYLRGYLCGFFESKPAHAELVELSPRCRVRDYLAELEADLALASGAEYVSRSRALRARGSLAAAHEPCSLRRGPDSDWSKGFLAGVFDATGTWNRGGLALSAPDPTTLRQVRTCLQALGFDFEQQPRPPHIALRIGRGLAEELRFLHTTGCVGANVDIAGRALASSSALEVAAVERLGVTLPMYDISTGSGDFIANGVVSHNCYARPTHEYLSFGSGVDFERKIVIKPRAPELLREAFEERSWRGELLMFSGNTDCYQPLEASYGLTRGCLEVCAEYRNPVHVISKAPLIERDIDVLTELARQASVGISISIPFWDEANARALEPFVATPARRLRTVRRLSEAGLDVTVNIAPLIPGLTDRDMPKIMEAAAEAGARGAALVLLRLPGNVKQVFEERLREKLPLSAEKVLRRTREMRGGKLNDPRFGERMRGSGNYYEAIQALFDRTAQRLGLNREHRAGIPATFRRPPRAGEQLELFRRG